MSVFGRKSGCEGEEGVPRRSAVHASNTRLAYCGNVVYRVRDLVYCTLQANMKLAVSNVSHPNVNPSTLRYQLNVSPP